MKVLAWDIETKPLNVYTWGLWDQNVAIGQIKESTEMICFGARWADKKQVIVKTVHHDGKQEMLDELWKLLDEADALLSWNGKGFDTKHAMREFIEAGMKPPSPFKEIDLMLVVRRVFKFPSNKLDYVAQRLLGQKKVSHTGFQMWLDVMAGDEKAWKLMVKYQKQDVNLLIELYDKLQPWIPAHPNRALHDGVALGCIACGSTNLQKRGLSVSSVSVFQRYQCMDCGKWMHTRVREASVPTMAPAV